MKKSIALLTGAACSLLVIVPASAADVNMGDVEAYENPFNGVYLGVHGGYGWADSAIDYSGNYDVSVSPDGFSSGEFDGSADIDSSGGLLGAQLGANYVMDSGLLLGAEVSGSWAAISGDRSFSDGDVDIDVDQDISAIGLGQLKLGWAQDNFAVYALGGFAMGRVETSADLSTDDFDIANLDEDETMTGWTIGAGADFMLMENVSIGVTYNYIDLGDYNSSHRVNSGAPPFLSITGEVDTETSVDIHVIKASLSYHF